jgi:hypothetical protein
VRAGTGEREGAVGCVGKRRRLDSSSECVSIVLCGVVVVGIY